MPRQNIILSISLLLCLLLILFIGTKGFVPHDEGWILNPTSRFMNGELPYKDFHFIYTPGTIFFTAFFFHLFGQSILVERIIVAILATLTTLCIFSVTRKISKSSLLPYLSSGIFLVWGPLHINFVWPVMLAIPLLCLASLCLLNGVQRRRALLFFLGGIAAALVFLSKQNFGIAIIASSVVYLLFFPGKKKRISLFFLGIIIGLLPCVLYFILTNTLTSFTSDMYYFMIEKTIFMGLQQTPLIYPAPLHIQILKTFFYASPLIISVAASVTALKQNKRLLIIGLACTFFYLFGIRPTTDYTHVIPLLSITGLPLALLLSSSIASILKKTLVFFAVCILGFGFYDVLFRNYYRWDEPILRHSYYNQSPRVRIWTSKHALEEFMSVSKVVSRYSKTNDYVFIYSYAPLYYFALERRTPTRFDFFPPLTKSDEDEILLDLKKKPVPLVLSLQNLTNDTSRISRYINQNYAPIGKAYFFIWKKK